jgi:endonuclease YncB( thermonuclease family)
MKRTSAFVGILCLFISWSVFAGDSLYGRVVAVRQAHTVTFDYGDGQYELRLVGVEVPKDGQLAREGVELVSKLVLGKNARMRFEGRSADGVMWSRLFTDDPVLGIRDVAVELVRAGLAVRGEDSTEAYKYDELGAAEREARGARRGRWASAR